MEVLFERSLLLIIVLLSCLCVWRASAKQAIPVKKIYHHKAVTDNSVEWGSCVLYGDGLTKGSITETFNINRNTEERMFFISRAFLSTAECQNMMKSVNKLPSTGGYTLSIEDVKKPEAGLMIRFIYPKDTCIISCKYFDSIQREKGIAFNVYNRTLVQNLKKREEPVLCTASLHKPPIIFLDPGHGGTDVGAVTDSGISEKNVCLAVSLEVKKILAQSGYTVYASRETDSTVPLDIRTYKAHKNCADLLVSIHANASPNKTATGVELFFLDPDFFNNQQGSVGQEEMSGIYFLLQKRSVLSNYLAECIHTALFKKRSFCAHSFKNRGIKKAVSQVLLGAYIPAILIELGFMTHPIEGTLLTNIHYQRALAQSIADGIHHYCVNM